MWFRANMYLRRLGWLAARPYTLTVAVGQFRVLVVAVYGRALRTRDLGHRYPHAVQDTAWTPFLNDRYWRQ